MSLNNSKKSNNIFSRENIIWLKSQLWAWVLLGIFIMSVFFYIAKGLIVIIGGTALGVYLYNLYGKDNDRDNDNDNYKGKGKGNNNDQNTSNAILNNTMGFVRNNMNTMNTMFNKNVKPIVKPNDSLEENFGSYNLFNKEWWKNTR